MRAAPAHSAQPWLHRHRFILGLVASFVVLQLIVVVWLYCASFTPPVLKVDSFPAPDLKVSSYEGVMPNEAYYIQVQHAGMACRPKYLAASMDCDDPSVQLSPATGVYMGANLRWRLMEADDADGQYVFESVGRAEQTPSCQRSHLSVSSSCEQNGVDLWHGGGANQRWSLYTAGPLDEQYIVFARNPTGRKCNQSYLSAVTTECTSNMVELKRSAGFSSGHRWRLLKVDDNQVIARLYYQRQRTIFQERALKVHWYFAQMSGLDPSAQTYGEMVQLRVESMAKMFRELGRDDFKLERDRCRLHGFFRRNRLPSVPVLRRWPDAVSLLEDMRSGKAFSEVREWPVFLKSCEHRERSVFRVESGGASHAGELVEWVEEQWLRLRKPDDAWLNLPKEDVGTFAMLHMLPGFLLQGPANFSRIPERAQLGIFEMKVEVLWGRAYMAALVINGTSPQLTWVFRGDREGHEREYNHQYPHAAFHTAIEHRSYDWVFEEGHMPCVWALAERAAGTIAADQVRLDIFIAQGDPRGCLLHDLSLSSGHPHGAHDSFLGRTWAEPHLLKQYKTLGDANSKPLYLQ